MSRILSSLFLTFLTLTADLSARAEEPKSIKPEEARQHVDQTITTKFPVRHAKHGVHRKTYFLDSEQDFRSEKNLGVQISEAVAAKLKQEKSIGEPHLHYADKTIRVTGKVFLQEDRAYLQIEKVDQIEIVETAN